MDGRKKHPVFIVATANKIDALPPELIRKGRLDEIFFVDLPKKSVHKLVFKIHFDKRKVAIDGIDLDKLASESNEFSGSEIEQVVVSAMYSSYASKNAIDTDKVLEEIRKTSPLSVVIAEEITYLRDWASQRTVAAD